MVSVIIPLYNKETTVLESLRSVLAQSWQNFEIIIVDDGSTDSSVKQLRLVQDSRIRLIRQQNGGVSAARNKGIAEAKGEWVTFLDADDLWKPDYLATLMSLAEKYPDCNVVATGYEYRNLNGDKTPIIINKMTIYGEEGVFENYFEVAACSSPPFCTISVGVKRKAILKEGGFPIGVKNGEDLLTWARLALGNRIAYDRRPLAVYMMDEQLFNEDQRTRIPSERDVVGMELRKMYDSHRDIKGLKEYVGLWHKMRGRHFLSKYRRIDALKELSKSLQYTISLKTIVLWTLCFLPMRIANRILISFSSQ